MPRPKKTVRSVYIHVGLPEDIVARVELELYSEAERRIPFGAWQKLITALLRQHISRLDEVKRPVG